MKKRLLSWLIVLTLCLTLLPTAAFAVDEGRHTHCICGATHEEIGDHKDEKQIEFATRLWYDTESKKLMRGEDEWKSQGVSASGGGTTINYVLKLRP